MTKTHAKELLIVVAIATVAFIAGYVLRHLHTTQASASLTPPPAGMVAASQAVAAEGIEFQLLNERYSKLVKKVQDSADGRELKREADELRGMGTRFQQDINNDLAGLKLSPQAFSYSFAYHSYVPTGDAAGGPAKPTK